MQNHKAAVAKQSQEKRVQNNKKIVNKMYKGHLKYVKCWGLQQDNHTTTNYNCKQLRQRGLARAQNSQNIMRRILQNIIPQYFILESLSSFLPTFI
jgi:hypothetical protein